MYKEIASLQKGKWPCAARLRLAALALDSGDAPGCCKACTELLTEGEGVDRSAVLHLMGAAFEKTGRLRQGPQGMLRR